MIINSFMHEGIELRRCQRAKAEHGTAQLYCSQGGATIDEESDRVKEKRTKRENYADSTN